MRVFNKIMYDIPYQYQNKVFIKNDETSIGIYCKVNDKYALLLKKANPNSGLAFALFSGNLLNLPLHHLQLDIQLVQLLLTIKHKMLF